jgi:hypothetical protein
MTPETKTKSVSRPDTKTANSSEINLVPKLTPSQKRKQNKKKKEQPYTADNIVKVMDKLGVEPQKGNQLAQSRTNSSVVNDLNKEVEKHQKILNEQTKMNKRLETSISNVVNLAQSSTEEDRKTVVSSVSLQGLAAIIAPECGAARLPDGTNPTALIQNTEVFSSNPTARINSDGDRTVQVIHSPTSSDQFFIVDKPNGTAMIPAEQTISGIFCGDLARDPRIKCPGVMFAIEEDTNKHYYVDNKGWFLFQYNYNATKSDYLRLRCEDYAPGTVLHIIGPSGEMVVTDQDGASFPNGFPLKAEETIIYKGGFPSIVDAGSPIYVPDDVFGFKFSIPINCVSKSSVLFTVQATKGNVNVAALGDMTFQSSLGEGDAWLGTRYAIFDEIGGQALDKSPKRVVGADMLIQYTGSALNAAYAQCRTFLDTVSIPEGSSIASHLSSGNRSFAQAINDANAPGCRSYYVPQLHAQWKDMILNVRNNPWTGAYEKTPFYQWASRGNVAPNDANVLVVSFKGSHSFEVTGSNKLFNYSTVAADPMWPMYHAVLVSEYKVTPNHSHWEHITSIFDSAVSKVKKFGETLLSNIDVSKILKTGAEIVVPALLGAIAAI